MGAFTDWLLVRRPAPLEDSTLGVLTYQRSGRWTGALREGAIEVCVYAGRRGPAPAVLSAAAAAVRGLPVFEARAREYLAVTSNDQPWPPLTLVAVQAGLPDPDWLQRQAAQENRRSVQSFAPGLPYVELQFSIEGDRNVVEAIFAGDTAVAWDYH